MGKIREIEGNVALSGSEPKPRRLKPGEVGGGGRGLRNIGTSLRAAAGNEVRALNAEREAATKRETTAMRVQLAQSEAANFNELNEKLKERKPGDAQFGIEFLREKNEQLALIKEDLTSESARQEFDLAAARYNTSLNQQVITRQAQQDGEFARISAAEELDARKTISLNAPLEMDTQIEELKTSVNLPDSLYANAPAATREQIIRDGIRGITVSGITGLIQASPELAEETLKNKTIQDRLNADDLPKFAKEIEGAKKARIADTRINRQEEKFRKDDLNVKTFTAAVNDISRGEGETAQAYMANSDMDITTRSRLVTFQKTVAELRNKPIEDNQLEKRNLRIGIDQGFVTQNDLIDSVNAGHLSLATYDNFSARIEKGANELTKLKERFVRRISPQIVKLNARGHVRDVTSSSRLENYEQAVTEAMEAELKAGRDPRQTIFKSTHASYMGSLATVGIYTVSRAEAQAADRALKGGKPRKSLSPAPTMSKGPQKKSGQSAADFLAGGGS